VMAYLIGLRHDHPPRSGTRLAHAEGGAGERSCARGLPADGRNALPDGRAIDSRCT
jgi:hypothetical protein